VKFYTIVLFCNYLILLYFYRAEWLAILFFIFFSLFFWIIICFSKLKVKKHEIPFFLLSYFENKNFVGITEKRRKLSEIKGLIDFAYYGYIAVIFVVLISFLMGFKG